MAPTSAAIPVNNLANSSKMSPPQTTSLQHQKPLVEINAVTILSGVSLSKCAAVLQQKKPSSRPAFSLF
jgi:hypothetical protein